MDTAIDQQELAEMFDKAVREVTAQTAGVHLYQCSDAPDGELCTVHIKFKKGFRTSISFCADMAMLKRMTQTVMRSEEITEQDLEDFTKEYFNQLCGRIASALFRETKVASRFGLPDFYIGRYEPEGHDSQFELNYSTGQQEGVQITHHVPRPGWQDSQPEPNEQISTKID